MKLVSSDQTPGTEPFPTSPPASTPIPSELKNTLKSRQKSDQKNKLNWFRRCLTVFIFYHLTAILLAPNSDHYLGEQLKPYFEPYWLGLELGGRWNFFAPEPGPVPGFIYFEIFDSHHQSILSDRMPTYPDHYFFRDRQIRRLSLIRAIIGDDQNIITILVPWLCRNHPEADHISLKKAFMAIPNILEVKRKERTLYDESTLQEVELGTFNCEGRRS